MNQDRRKRTGAEQALCDLIHESGGHITLADYMAFCLNHPLYGYYRTQKPLGKGGDFITAPEISQIFGELLGLWFIDAWESKGCPSKIAFLELGPGRGLLMKDIVSVMALRPALLEALTIHFVEINPHLKKEQTLTLAPLKINHHNSLGAALKTIGTLPTFCLANEFFDVLPLDQYVYKKDAWHKRYVTYEGEKKGFRFKDIPPQDPFPNYTVPLKPKAGTTLEVAPLVDSFFHKLVTHLSQNSGAGLIIDYGYDQFGYGDTVQALKKHKSTSVLKDIGQVDLTSHVNFAKLLHIAQSFPNVKVNLETQGAFLVNLGIKVRTESVLTKVKNPPLKNRIQQATDRLIHPAQMGNLFKVLQLRS